tara:strand:- start:869 stop:982 length:114 start_codon:yes stop_codon:yes gene_type:complete
MTTALYHATGIFLYPIKRKTLSSDPESVSITEYSFSL